jgi:hypothetical protein
MIIVECDPDEFLIKAMGFSKIKHGGCKGKVLSAVKKKSGVIGIIDEDPDSGQPSEMHEYVELESKSSIKLLVRKEDKNKMVIVISPELEPWILNRARKNQLSPKDFGLPDDADGLKRIPHIERKKNFKEFIMRLIEKDEEIKTLKQWLRQ